MVSIGPVQQFTCFLLVFFLVLHARFTFFSFLFVPQLLSMRLCPVCTAATWIVFPPVSLSLPHSVFSLHMKQHERYSILFGLCLIPMYFALLFDVKHMCLKAQGRSCLWLFCSSACFLITICRFLAVLSSLRRQISLVCSRFAWWAFNILLLLTFLFSLLFLFGIMQLKMEGFLVVFGIAIVLLFMFSVPLVLQTWHNAVIFF